MASSHSLEPSGLPPDKGIEHVILLEPVAQPPFKHMYRLSPSELIEVKRQVTELLQKQLIEPSVSPCYSLYSKSGVSYAW